MEDFFCLDQQNTDGDEKRGSVMDQTLKIGSGKYRMSAKAQEKAKAMIKKHEEGHIEDNHESIAGEILVIQHTTNATNNKKIHEYKKQNAEVEPYDELVNLEKKKKKEKKKHSSTKKQAEMYNKPINDGRNIPIYITNDRPLQRDKKREVDIDSVVRSLKRQHRFLCVAGRKLYAFTGKYYEDITEKSNAAAVFKEFLSEETNRLIRDYTEIYNQLLSDKEIWYSSIDEIRRNRDAIVFENGTYDVLGQQFYENQFWEDDYIFSIIRFEYQPFDKTGKEFVDRFVETFCSGDWKKRQLFYEIIGFCLSNYENKKACFYFLGVPNSGKSSVCRFLETAVGSDAYISVAVKQLSSRFVSGDLEGVKVCADEDVAVRTPLKSEDVSLIKKIASSDKIRTDAKYQKPGQLHPECKLVWAGNGMMSFETSEDLQPLMERMVIFPLDNEIPECQRDPNIVDKLLIGRNYIITEALDALYDLVDNDFRFTKVVQTEDYFNAKNFASGIEEFVESCCELDGQSRESTSVLYEAYIRFCGDHPEYKPKSINPFSSYLDDKYGLETYNNGKSRGKIGIRICSTDALTQ